MRGSQLSLSSLGNRFMHTRHIYLLGDFTGRFTFTALNRAVQSVALTLRHCETQ